MRPPVDAGSDVLPAMRADLSDFSREKKRGPLVARTHLMTRQSRARNERSARINNFRAAPEKRPVSPCSTPFNSQNENATFFWASRASQVELGVGRIVCCACHRAQCAVHNVPMNGDEQGGRAPTVRARTFHVLSTQTRHEATYSPRRTSRGSDDGTHRAHHRRRATSVFCVHARRVAAGCITTADGTVRFRPRHSRGGDRHAHTAGNGAGGA